MPNCESCKEKRKQTEDVPYLVHEASMARMERANKRLLIVVILLIVLLVASNIIWIVYENSFEDVITTIEAEQETSEGGNNYAVVGDMIGTAKSESND